jgi:TfoX/Sxy family transcriptional regulator of competence genes
MPARTKAKSGSDKPKRVMPSFTKAPDDLVRTFENAMKDFPTAVQRKTFGYPSAFINGNMFAGLFQQEMFLRLSDEDRSAMRSQYGTSLFEPLPGRPMRGYVLVPRYVLNSTKLLKTWLAKGMAYAGSLPPKVKKKKS